MKVLSLAMQLPAVLQAASAGSLPFSSNFTQPDPPLIKSEFKANWNQHKWDVNHSNIAAGFLYNSPSQNKVRADMAYDSTLGSSLFDYNDVTADGVANRLWTLSPAVASPAQVWTGYVEPGFPLVSEDMLVQSNAVYGGVVQDPFVGEVTAWDIMFKDVIPTTVFVGTDGIVQGYDFWSPGLRTRVITRFFNIILGKISSDVFDFPA